MSTPRNVRPAWLSVSVDGARSGPRGMGPKARDGALTGSLTLRTLAGDVSEPIEWDARMARTADGADDGARLMLDVPTSVIGMVTVNGIRLATLINAYLRDADRTTRTVPRCAECGESASTRADGTARHPLQHRWGPVSHGSFVAERADNAEYGAVILPDGTRVYGPIVQHGRVTE